MTWLSDYPLGSVVRDKVGRWFKVSIHTGKGFVVVQPCGAKGEPNSKGPEAFKDNGAWVAYYKARPHETPADMDERIAKAIREFDPKDDSHINPDDDDNLSSNGISAVSHAPPPPATPPKPILGTPGVGGGVSAGEPEEEETDPEVAKAADEQSKKPVVMIPGTDPENPLMNW